MPKNILALAVVISLFTATGCKQDGPAPGTTKLTPDQVEAQKRRDEAQRQLEAQRKADEEMARARAEEQRLAQEADKAAKAKAAQTVAATKLPAAVTVADETKVSLPDSGKKVLAHLRANEAVPYELLTQAFLDLHFAQRQPNHPDQAKFDAFVRTVEPVLAESIQQPGNFKRTLEQKLVEEFRLSEIQYDKDKVNLLDAFTGFTQCYSGTALYSVFYRKAAQIAGDKFKDQYPVIVFTKGHIYPGYFVRVENKWVLYQVETTQAGEGVMQVGSVDNFGAEALRIVLVHDFLLSEVLKHAATAEELEKFKVAALGRAAVAFDLPLEKLEARVKKEESGGAVDPKKLNSGIFAFGKSEETAGAKPRVYSRALPSTVAKVPHSEPETRRELNPAWKPGDSPGYQYIAVPTGKMRTYELNAAPDIFIKVLDGDEAALKQYLAGKGTPDLYTSEGFQGAKGEYVYQSTLLGAALKGKRANMVKLLLEAGADPFAHGSGGFFVKSPAIIQAIEEKNYDALKQMAAHVKNLDLRLSQSWGKYKVGSYTVLALAVEKNDAEAVKILLAAGAKPEAELDSRYTVRDHAAFLKRDFRIGAPVADQLK